MIQRINKKILYLYTGDHPVHRKIAESIGARILPLGKKIPLNYDIYISEGDYLKLSLLKFLRRLRTDQKVIVLFSDPRLFYLNIRKKFNPYKQKLSKSSFVRSSISKFLIRKLDGAICLSQFEGELLNSIAPKLKKITHYPFIEQQMFKKLMSLKPRLNNKKILFVGNGPDWYYKGLDSIIQIARQVSDKEFIIIGGQWEGFINEREIPKNVFFKGRKTPKELIELFKESSLYVHLGRGEAFGVSISEAMASGIPCIISKQTGAKELIEPFIPSNVVNNISEAKISITEYFNLKLAKKKELSQKFKKSCKILKEDLVVRQYKKNIKEFVENV